MQLTYCIEKGSSKHMYNKFSESMERYAINISKNMYNCQAALKQKCTNVQQYIQSNMVRVIILALLEHFYILISMHELEFLSYDSTLTFLQGLVPGYSRLCPIWFHFLFPRSDGLRIQRPAGMWPSEQKDYCSTWTGGNLTNICSAESKKKSAKLLNMMPMIFAQPSFVPSISYENL